MEFLFVLLGLTLILIGILGNFLPVIPTPVTAWCAYLLCFICIPDGPINVLWLVIATGLTIFAHAFEFVGSWFGAKWFGATWRGALGAMIGGIGGSLLFLFLPIPFGVLIGLVTGSLLGALAGELLGGRDWGEAGKAGIGAVIGNLSAMLLKLSVCLFLLGAFLALSVWHLVDNFRSEPAKTELHAEPENRSGAVIR